MPEEESIFDKVVSAGERCSNLVLGQLKDIVESTGVSTDYGKKEVLEELTYWFSRSIPDLELMNEDWDWHYKNKRLKREYLNMMRRVEDGLEYECDRIFGFERPLLKKEEAKTEEERKAIELAHALLEPFIKAEEEFFSKMGYARRKAERDACRRAVKSALVSFGLCMLKDLKDILE